MIHCIPCILPFGSKAQIQSLGLRYEVLRRPLGLRFDPDDLAAEKDELHFGLMRGEYVVACLLLKKAGEGVMKMRQVAVAPDEQGRGHGKALVTFCENWCSENGIRRMELHARETAVPFYLSMGYTISGEPFEEVGLPHRFMSKNL